MSGDPGRAGWRQHTGHTAGSEDAARRLAAGLLEDVSAISQHLTDFVMREVPELVRPQDPTWPATVYRAARANASAILATLAEGVDPAAAETPVEARAFFERQAEQEDGLVTVLRTYRLGIAELWQLWAAHVAAAVGDAADLAAVLATSAADFTAYQDRMAEESAAHWRETRLRKRAGLDRSPADIVRGALAGGRAEDLAQLGAGAAPRDRRPLLGDDAAAVRLRTTLRAYLALGESHVRAAQRLGVHEKTVAYRVRQAEELLGRRLAERRVELESALLLHEILVVPRGVVAGR